MKSCHRIFYFAPDFLGFSPCPQMKQRRCLGVDLNTEATSVDYRAVLRSLFASFADRLGELSFKINGIEPAPSLDP
jgi:hypothetical protein